ncbi:hypothetical protein ONS95_013742 [Cadophora gregata]|uniref:uncharacterized protein n=1 Tax=Cadophora gregata TaxID=51156 RepID=UPI0026DB004B|nr:uncharacterized protein ONS95_013742 [Cadophora gregata]KAK0114243.1 hypothetical protein ONS95_013742 [Cadophora gregata]
MPLVCSQSLPPSLCLPTFIDFPSSSSCSIFLLLPSVAWIPKSKRRKAIVTNTKMSSAPNPGGPPFGQGRGRGSGRGRGRGSWRGGRRGRGGPVDQSSFASGSASNKPYGLRQQPENNATLAQEVVEDMDNQSSSRLRSGSVNQQKKLPSSAFGPGTDNPHLRNASVRPLIGNHDPSFSDIANIGLEGSATARNQQQPNQVQNDPSTGLFGTLDVAKSNNKVVGRTRHGHDKRNPLLKTGQGVKKASKSKAKHGFSKGERHHIQTSFSMFSTDDIHFNPSVRRGANLAEINLVNGMTKEQITPKAAEDLLVLDYYNGEPRQTGDYPTHTHMPKLRQLTQAVVFVSGINILGAMESTLVKKMNLKYHFSSQNPAVVLSQVNGEDKTQPLPFNTSVPIHREHMTPFHINNEKVITWRKIVNLAASMQEQLDIFQNWMGTDMSSKQLGEIQDHFTKLNCVEIDCLNFCVRKDSDFHSDSELGEIVRDFALKANVVLVVMRDPQAAGVNACTDRFFDMMMQNSLAGAYWFYKAQLDNVKMQWIKELQKIQDSGSYTPITFPGWMQSVDPQTGDVRVLSNTAYQKFDSLEDYRFQFSLAIYRDHMHAAVAHLQNYGEGKPHGGTIVSINPTTRRCQIDFNIKNYGGLGRPPLPADTITIRLVSASTEPDELSGDHVMEHTPEAIIRHRLRSSEVGGTESVIQTQNAIENNSWPSHAYSAPAPVQYHWRASRFDTPEIDNADYRAAITLDDSQLSLFTEGQDCEFEIFTKSSDLAAVRQMKAISFISRHVNRYDENYALQSMIMGRKIRLPQQPLFELCTNELRKAAVKAYFKASSLNPQQKEVMYKSFWSGDFLTLIQGSPGTSMSVTNSVIGTISVILGNNTLVVAPSNKTVWSLMKKLIKQRQTVNEQQPGMADEYKLIYFGTLRLTKSELQSEHEPSLDDEYHHWYCIVNTIKSWRGDMRVPAGNEDQEAARVWVQQWDKIQSGGLLDAVELASYLSLGMKAAPKVFQDETLPMIVVSTCNNSAQLAEWKLQFPVVLNDEHAFCNEPDSIIPLQMGCKKLIATSDREQLSPVSHALGASEQFDTFSLPPFRRLLQLYADKCVTLTIN